MVSIYIVTVTCIIYIHCDCHMYHIYTLWLSHVSYVYTVTVICIICIHCDCHVYHMYTLWLSHVSYSAKVWRGKTLMNEVFMKFWQAKLKWIDCWLYMGETLRKKSLVGKTLMNRWLFIKFIRLSIFKLLQCMVHNDQAMTKYFNYGSQEYTNSNIASHFHTAM